jgi:hypothetical protein
VSPSDASSRAKVGTPYDREYARLLAVPTGRWLGFFHVARGRKRAA